jgi:integrase
MRSNKCNVNFILDRRRDKETGKPIVENVPINMDFTFDGKRLRFFTGYRIDASKWIDSKKEDPASGEIIHIQQVKKNAVNRSGESYSDINRRLIKLKESIIQIYNEDRILGKDVTVETLRSELRDRLNEEQSGGDQPVSFFDVFQTYIDTAKVSPGRKKSIGSTLNHFKRFEKTLPDSITFENLTPAILKKFYDYLLNDAKDPKEYESMKAQKRPRVKSLNTISGNLKRLRAFLEWASLSENGSYIQVSPFKEFKIVQEEYGRPIYLKKEERDLLYSAEIKEDRLRRVRDIFVFQCLIGCRFGDLIKLTKANIIDGAVEYIPRKTKDDRPVSVRVPLCDKAKDLISRYDLPDGSLFPYITDQRYNDYIKDLFKEVGLDRIVTRLNPISREEEKLPLYDVASSHLARRTFVGILHKSNVKNEIIASMSGHKKDSKSFARYYDIDDETQDQVINKYLE